MEITNLSNKDLKAMVITMLTELRRRMDELSVNFNKELENVRKNESELKDTITEIKNTLEGTSSRSDDTEQISDLEDRIVEITQSYQQKEKKIFLMRRFYGTSGTISNLLTFTLWGSQKDERERKTRETI